jgi:hypothetical protein
MQTEVISNDNGVSLLLVPGNEMEELMVKQLMKQENELIDVRNPISVLSKTFKSAILIGKKLTPPANTDGG